MRTKMEYEVLHHLFCIQSIKDGAMHQFPTCLLEKLERRSRAILEMCMKSIVEHEEQYGAGTAPNWTCYPYPDDVAYRQELDDFAEKMGTQGRKSC